jgi:hypothetical protein
MYKFLRYLLFGDFGVKRDKGNLVKECGKTAKIMV